MASKVAGKLVSVVVVGALLFGAYQLVKPDFDNLPEPKPDSKPEKRMVRIQVYWNKSPRDPGIDYLMHVGPAPVQQDTRGSSPAIYELAVPVGVSVRVDAAQYQNGLLECAIFVNMSRKSHNSINVSPGGVTCETVVK